MHEPCSCIVTDILTYECVIFSLLFTDGWNDKSHPYKRLDFGKWEIVLPVKSDGSCPIPHLSRVKVRLHLLSNI